MRDERRVGERRVTVGTVLLLTVGPIPEQRMRADRYETTSF
jgi:hypothetical protein